MLPGVLVLQWLCSVELGVSSGCNVARCPSAAVVVLLFLECKTT